MDSFDYRDVPTRPKIDLLSLVVNVLTALVLLAVLGVGILYLVVFINPYVGFNPFPPPTLPALMQFPTLTPTPPNILPPTWTPTATRPPTLTPTPRPSATPTEIPPASPPAAVTQTATLPPEGMPYALQQGNPIAIPNIGHAELGCNWMGVAGQATGLNREAKTGLIVQLGGELQGKVLSMMAMTGTATQYGPAGYEFVLGDRPVASKQTLWVQLLDLDSSPVSEKVYFETYADCKQNLILINFNQLR